MNRPNSRISVIMACFNSSAYLDEAVNSVLGQTLSDLELILVDDCSTDNTLEIAKRFQVLDDRILVLTLPVNSGPAIARNAGIRVAKGDWLGILDSDDVAMPLRFEEQMKLADSEQGSIMIGSNSISIDEKGHIIKQHKYPTNHKALTRRLSSLFAFPPHSSMVYRKDRVQKLSAYNPRYMQSEDIDLWFRLSETGKVTCVDKPLVKIRKHAQNLSNSEGGSLQTCMGVVASVCHFLRVNRYSDPSSSNDDSFWQLFIKWVNQRVTEEGVFERRQAWAKSRAAFYATDNRLAGALSFANHLLQSGHATALIWEKYFGSSLPKRLASEWMERVCAIS